MAANVSIVVIPPTPSVAALDDWGNAKLGSPTGCTLPVSAARLKRSNSDPTEIIGFLRPSRDMTRNGVPRGVRSLILHPSSASTARSGRAYIRSSLRNQSDISSATVTTELLVYWSRTIRNDLVPHITQDGLLPSESDMAGIKAFVEQLVNAHVTADMLRHSRIHLALLEMHDCDGWWSAGARQRADVALTGWESRYGDLRDLVDDPWSEGGRMVNVLKLREDIAHWGPNKPETATWIVQRPGIDGQTQALRTGDLEFEVGHWWIKPAAAVRDGIIDSCDGITAGPSEAYAIVLTEADEQDPDSLMTSLHYRPPSTQPKRVKLMRNLTNRKPIRVLRRHKLKSPLAPELGIRYDGLYAVKGYSINAHALADEDNPALVYTFKLERLAGQATIEFALQHPTAEEKDDWHAYQKHKHEHTILPQDVEVEKVGQFLVRSSRNSSVIRSRQHSGFFSEDIMMQDGGYFAAAPHPDAETTANAHEEFVSPTQMT